MYLENFELPSVYEEEDFLDTNKKLKRTCYASVYPFHLFPNKELRKLEFAPITILYGGNGSGKTSLLNIIAEKLKLERGTYFNQTPFFVDYIELCTYNLFPYAAEVPKESSIITSDDVFDYMLDVRCINQHIDDKREELLVEYKEAKYASFQMKSLEEYDKLKRHNDVRRLTGSKYVKDRLMKNITEKSNGESAFMYFTEHIKENRLYLLDEPENSLEIGAQLELVKFIEDSARFFDCQFIIATHSPFLMAMKGAYIYDLDTIPVGSKKWTELKNVKLYYEFFKKHEKEFER